MLTQYEIFLNPKVNNIGAWGSSHQPLRQGMVGPGYKGLMIPFPSPEEGVKVQARNRNFLISASYPAWSVMEILKTCLIPYLMF